MHGQRPPTEPYESTHAYPIPIYVKHPERMIKLIDLKIFDKISCHGQFVIDKLNIPSTT